MKIQLIFIDLIPAEAQYWASLKMNPLQTVLSLSVTINAILDLIAIIVFLAGLVFMLVRYTTAIPDMRKRLNREWGNTVWSGHYVGNNKARSVNRGAQTIV